ncbi:Alpha-1,3-mannosyl-glycoprotein 4-beta-N-acetylglucosaminyltransferase-like protein MGAT4D [Oopsacas minuta]|uniref:Alpha-1,3-mannosyl-glycoprotein 4-beta-N-acetylglucosaminyltransferase-like protein MGAT4D n=1 Tax=Oopsacas minuta TaxID=111878 RepID=A0AAV7K2T7_9METZ|nr:Alpha-1,3-mannosyl-glycoprotein 4-beta-N-acetylglucosaminyltransferase-like protein MGAT4D [Oopsacas minuta]
MNNYFNATLELDKLSGDLNVNTTPTQIQMESNTIFLTDDNTNDHKYSILNTKFNYKKPGYYHPFILLSDVSIDKFRIIPEKRRNDYKFVYGIPTVARPQKEKYLLDTLDSLLKDPASFRELNILIIIFVADIDTDRCTSITSIVTERHGELIDRGFIEILCPHPTLYPSLDNVRQTLGDPEDRFKWRSKQNLDYAFMMWYASGKGEYYLQLEDDIIASRGYTYHINDYVNKVKDDFWFVIRFTQLGFIGKLMRANDLISFVQYLLLFYTNQPSDWLLYDYTRGLICYYEDPITECPSLVKKLYLFYTPSLFQHMGTISSLKGKIQNLKDPTFKRN